MTAIFVDEYLNTSYRPDLEFVDGFLVERGMSTASHGLLQAIVAGWFYVLRNEFRLAVMTEPRTQIVARARYRIPDVLLCASPVKNEKVITSVPWAVIEILSPDDRMPAQLERFRDYKKIGVRYTILLDPEEQIAFRF